MNDDSESSDFKSNGHERKVCVSLGKSSDDNDDIVRQKKFHHHGRAADHRLHDKYSHRSHKHPEFLNGKGGDNHTICS